MTHNENRHDTESLDKCDKCGKETAELVYVGKCGYDFVCAECAKGDLSK